MEGRSNDPHYGQICGESIMHLNLECGRKRTMYLKFKGHTASHFSGGQIIQNIWLGFVLFPEE